MEGFHDFHSPRPRSAILMATTSTIDRSGLTRCHYGSVDDVKSKHTITMMCTLTGAGFTAHTAFHRRSAKGMSCSGLSSGNARALSVVITYFMSLRPRSFKAIMQASWTQEVV
jgi:hypothetical protein